MSEIFGWQVRRSSLQWASRLQPEVPQGWARLRLVLGGVCGTDLQLIQGYAGFEGFLGHEFVARVTQCQDPPWLGKLVVGEINVGCGHCPECAQGDARLCPRRTVLGIRGLDGAFAESFQLPLANLHPVDDLDPTLSVWCEPLAAALEVRQHLPASCKVLILGDGRLGSLIALGLQADHEVTVLGRHPGKLDRLRRLGLHAVSEVSGSWPAVVEATGSAQGLSQALQMARAHGTVVLKSTVARPEAVDMTPLVVNALTLVGSRCGRFEPALQALRSGLVDPRPLVDQVLDLSEFPGAIGRRDWVKVLLRG
ncbi:alcohol dehydrogenase catalytic domain-containing protein [bacterium]|nr:alcohol dehydrogenase catalytic domain-containing protein [bacterium]